MSKPRSEFQRTLAAIQIGGATQQSSTRLIVYLMQSVIKGAHQLDALLVAGAALHRKSYGRGAVELWTQQFSPCKPL